VEIRKKKSAMPLLLTWVLLPASVCLSENPLNFGSHIIQGQWILLYHRWLNIESACNQKQRHFCSEYLNDDSTIRKVEGTKAGVGPAATGNTMQTQESGTD